MRDTFIKIPFASGGDKTAIPNGAQPDGSISYQQGWGIDYEREFGVDPAAKTVDRQAMNQVLFDATTAINRWQSEGFPEWIDAAANGGAAYPYSKGTIVRFPISGGGFVLRTSLTDSNVSTPSATAATAQWGDPMTVLSGSSFVPMNSPTGAGFLPEGDVSQRPPTSPTVNTGALLLRGSTQDPTDYYPEFYKRVSGIWSAIADRAWTNTAISNAVAAAINALTATLDKWIGFTIIYPNGGSAGSPANVSLNTRYVLTNPFPGYHVMAEAEIFYNGIWASPGWDGNTGTGGSAVGARASQVTPNDEIILQTGRVGVLVDSPLTGGGHGATIKTALSSAPCRIKIWKLRGTI